MLNSKSASRQSAIKRLASKKKIFKRSSIYLAFLLTAFGCGGTGQDVGQRQDTQQTVGGLAIDGYLARATVFLDYDNNSTRDPWEPFAFTDDDGFYSYNPITDTDYCAADIDAQSALYCLRNKRQITDVVIRIDGGYDVLTGEPFLGQLSRRVELTGAGQQSSVLVSPLTTLFTNIHSSDARTSVLTALGIDETDLDVDFMNIDGADAVDSTLLNATLKVHKTVSLLANQLQSRYQEIGSQTGAANDLTASVYRHLAAELGNRNTSLDELLGDTQAMTDILQAVEADAQKIYDQWDVALTTEIGNQVLMDYSRTLGQANNIVQIINQLIPPGQTLTAPDGAKGRARLVETMVTKALRESSGGSTFGNAVNFIREPANQALLNALIDGLGADSFDLDNLANHSFSGNDFTTVDDIRDLVQLPINTQAFHNLAGKQLRVADMDLGSAPNHLKDSEVELYFHGTTDATRGSFEACIKYIKDAHSDGTLGDANTRGELVKGYWSLLNANQNDGSSYSLLLNIQFLGTTYQAILKPAGTANINNVTMQTIRFDHAGKLRAWHSIAGLQPAGAIPASDADCEQRLPSRVGI